MKGLRSKERSIFIPLAVLLAVSVWLVPSHAGLSQPSDAASIQQGMQEVIDFLDSPGYAQAVSWDEHVVLVYRLAQGRMPSPLEFFLLGAFREDIGLTRSASLSVALRGEALCPTCAQCRAFLNRVSVSDFQTDQVVRQRTRKLAAIPRRRIIKMLRQMAKAAEIDRPRKELQAELPVANVQYNTYFGYLHAHSELSDGEGSPLGAYIYARDQGGLDFFALTDHGEYLCIWPWENKWEELVNAAEATYDPGTYVTLWGFEWSNPILGHINVLNTPDYTNAIFHFWITWLYDWISDRPEAFGRFNHPGEYDYLWIEFLHLRPYADAMPQMVGIETWNGNDSFDKYYYDGSWFPFFDYSYWDVGNLRGWYLGALGGQDNHSRQWGTLNEFRTAVLVDVAEDLTREQIVDAYLNRRFYVTEDKDLYLDLRCQGFPMGTRLFGVARQFKVTAWDDSGDTFHEVRFYRDGSLLQTETVSGNSIEGSFDDPSPTGANYYYVIVQQYDDNDGNGRKDEAISSPIWID
ncbi:hypothetical protein AC480_00095 [miscellaneous Crenarchaeota group archaeon SMTZ1-55]|nr:MAG: hypothetical protein AC480_00095 [miscellaneous Crenarchaeota group archaeon SMTZ1-55]